MTKSIVYVDGFNLYYGCLKGSKEKWLDLAQLLALLLPREQIVRIRYFTAKVTDRNGDTGPRVRQQAYLRALATLPNLDIHYGQFTVHEKSERVVPPEPIVNGRALKFVKVYKTEEKGSDVNMATSMIVDAHKNACDKAILITNDSDLVPPVRAVRNEFGRPVIVLAPTANPGRRVAASLKQVASSVHDIRRGPLSGAQFAPTLTDKHGAITKPPEW